MNLPSKTLNRWIDGHKEMVFDAEYGDGYCTESGKAYNILLNRGYCWNEWGMHTIIDETALEALKHLKESFKCECKDCITGEGW